MIIIIKNDKSPELSIYMQTVHNNLQKKQTAINPFNGFVRQFRDYYVLEIKPIYPNPFWLGVVLLAIPFLVSWGRPKWWFFAFGIPLYGSFFWSKCFFKLMLKLGYKKTGGTNRMVFDNFENTIKSFCQ